MRYALIYIIASQLVSLQDVFHLAVQFSKYIQVFACRRSLKTIQVQEEEQSFRPALQDFLWLFAFYLSLSADLQTRSRVSVSTWNEPLIPLRFSP